MSDRLPDFAIIGAQKSASTYVHGLLRAHPDIYMPAQEIRFFEDPEYGSGDIRRLRELFCGRTESRWGIKRPDYLARAEVAPRLWDHIPDIRLIAILREPISRLLSAYYYYIKLGFLPVLDINEGLQRILDGENLGSSRARELLEYGNYASHLEQYLQYFPREQLLVLLQEEVTSNGKEVAERLYGFLGVKTPDCLPVVAKDNSGLYSLPRLRVLTQRNRFLYRYDAAEKLEQKSGLLSYGAAGAITLCDRYLLAPWLGNAKPQLNPGLRQALCDYYADQLHRLEPLLGLRVDHWIHRARSQP